MHTGESLKGLNKGRESKRAQDYRE